MELGPEDVSLLERCPHFRGWYVRSSPTVHTHGMYPQDLESEWERQQGQEALLAAQLKRIQDDLRRVNHQLEGGRKEKTSLDEKIGQYIHTCILSLIPAHE